MPYRLPEKWIEAMRAQLPKSEWDAFFAVFEQGAKPKKGLRVNTLKISVDEFKKITPYPLKETEWDETVFSVEEDKLGLHPFHSAGLYYSQEPSATSVVPKLEIREGERVLDLCSAPGGKGTQIAAKLKGTGLLVLNEPVFSRAQILSQNVERLGAQNAVVLCEKPETLEERFEAYFDKILVDAPCSGEGMFRKNAETESEEWSEEAVELCAKRAEKILSSAVKMLKGGGRLVFSTCTFALKEDEEQTQNLLARFPELTLKEEKKLYPHRHDGEGHYYAVFEKSGENRNEISLQPLGVSRETKRAFDEFAKNFLVSPVFSNLYEGENGALFSLPENAFLLKNLCVLRAGVRLGERKGDRFEPSHSLAMAVKRSDVKSALDLALDDPRLKKYLHGESIEADGKNGWVLVCVNGYPVGLGKRVNGQVKNHLPKALRIG